MGGTYFCGAAFSGYHSSHLYVFMDQRKSHAISAFFASLGHELKTPLASIRLQGQVISELAADREDLAPYLERLNEDTEKLEIELEKILATIKIRNRRKPQYHRSQPTSTHHQA